MEVPTTLLQQMLIDCGHQPSIESNTIYLILIRSSHLKKRTTPGENRGQSSETKSLALSTLLARLVLSTVLSALTGLLLLLARLLLAAATLLLAGLALAALVLLARTLLVRIAHNRSYLDIRTGIQLCHRLVTFKSHRRGLISRQYSSKLKACAAMF
jgi:hypothetical protein